MRDKFKTINMKKVFLILIIFIALFSCKQSRQEADDYAEHTVDINNPVKISIDKFITDFDTIRLEVTNESLMRNASVIHIMDDRFYIKTNRSSGIYVFDLKGKYLFKINDKGQGPNEYIQITGFEVDPVNKRIIIADSFSKKILVYNKDGKLMDVIQLDFPPDIIAFYKNGFVNLYSGFKRFFTNPKMENYNLHFLDSSGKFVSSAIPKETPNSINITNANMLDCLENGDILFQPVLSNIVYKISNDSATPFYAFNNLSKYKLLTKKDKKTIELIHEPGRTNSFVEKEKEGYLINWGSVIDLTDFICFQFSGWRKTRYLYYSKKTSRTILIEPENVEGEKNLVEILMSQPVAAKGNTLYISPSSDLIDIVKGKLKNEKLNTFFNNTGFDSNPVIISFSINFPEE